MEDDIQKVSNDNLQFLKRSWIAPWATQHSNLRASISKYSTKQKDLPLLLRILTHLKHGLVPLENQTIQAYHLSNVGNLEKAKKVGQEISPKLMKYHAIFLSIYQKARQKTYSWNPWNLWFCHIFISWNK